MKITILILTLIFTSKFIFSQSDTTRIKIVDEMPIFNGSNNLIEFHSYLSQNIDLSGISQNLVSGRVIVQFCVDSTGQTTDVRIIKSLRDDLDKAVVNAIKNSPKWIPGKKDGKPVKVLYTIPMDFDFQ